MENITDKESVTKNAPEELLPKRGAVSVGQTTYCKFRYKQHLLPLVVTATYSITSAENMLDYKEWITRFSARNTSETVMPEGQICLKRHFLYALHVTGKSK